MTRLSPTAEEKLVVRIPCPHCNAGAGRWCRTLRFGGQTDYLHEARVRAYERQRAGEVLEKDRGAA